MIAFDREHHLGRKAFFIFLARRVGVGFILFFVAIFLSIVKDGIINGGAQAFMAASSVAVPSASNIMSSYIVYGINGVFVISLILIIVGFIIGWLEYINYAYTLSEFDLRMRRGVLNRREISIPYRQIQDVDIDRNFANILLGLSRIVMQTAAHEEADEKGMTEVVLEPVDKAIALDLRDILERRIGVQVVEDEKAADVEEKISR